MENEKKSFLFYFDNYPMVQALPPEQRGWLLSALCVYADGVWRDETLTMEQVLEGFPRMDRETRIAELSRRYRRTSPAIIGTPYVEKRTCLVGSKLAMALIRPMHPT